MICDGHIQVFSMLLGSPYFAYDQLNISLTFTLSLRLYCNLFQEF
jgi:hypothetical protein